jgi:hypothetical protein
MNKNILVVSTSICFAYRHGSAKEGFDWDREISLEFEGMRMEPPQTRTASEYHKAHSRCAHAVALLVIITETQN